MPRRTRKQLVLEDEELTRRDREEGYRRLEIQLHREWREDAFSWHISSGEGVQFGVVKTPKLLVNV